MSTITTIIITIIMIIVITIIYAAPLFYPFLLSVSREPRQTSEDAGISTQTGCNIRTAESKVGVHAFTVR